MNLSKYKSAKLTLKPNYQKIPVTRIEMNQEGAEEFNELYFYAKKIKNKIIRTPSGGISLNKLRLPCWDVRNLLYCVELTILDIKGMFRFQFRGKIRDLDQMASGRTAFSVFKKVVAKHGVDLNSLAISNGKSLKKEIEIPLIKLERKLYAGMTFEGVHHVDFRQSYPAGLIKYHPEFKEAIESMYRQRAIKPIFKAVLDYSIGFMQSPFSGYKWTHLAKDAIHDNNERVKELAEFITKKGGVIILFNTDGFWFKGPIIHGPNEGEKIGQWHYDHIDCKFRAKSAGAYEFIENETYYPVVRGRTNYDTIKPRESWEWGDIYRNDCVPIKWIFDEEKGVVEYEEKDISEEN